MLCHSFSRAGLVQSKFTGTCSISNWIKNLWWKTSFFANCIREITFRSPMNYLGKSSFKWSVTVRVELMFLESYGYCDVTKTVTLLLWRHKTISYYDFW